MQLPFEIGPQHPMPMPEQAAKSVKPIGPSATHPVERFLKAIESKTSAPPHARILKAARAPDPTAAMNMELSKLADEIVDEA